MARLNWNAGGTRYFEAGVDRGVLFIGNLAGLPWDGLISVDENPAGAENQAFYIDGEKYLNLAKKDEFEATIKAFTYPVQFAACDGTARVRSGLFFGQQERKPFGFSYRTLIGNDTSSLGNAYKIHLVYNALVTPTTRSSTTFGDSVEPSDFTWNLTTKSAKVYGHNSTAHAIIDTRYTHAVTLATIEDILYGTDENVARLPTPQELIEIFDIPVVFGVVNNGDGTFRVEGPDENVLDVGEGAFMLDHPSIIEVDPSTFTLTYE